MGVLYCSYSFLILFLFSFALDARPRAEADFGPESWSHISEGGTQTWAVSGSHGPLEDCIPLQPPWFSGSMLVFRGVSGAWSSFSWGATRFLWLIIDALKINAIIFWLFSGSTLISSFAAAFEANDDDDDDDDDDDEVILQVIARICACDACAGRKCCMVDCHRWPEVSTEMMPMTH